MKRAIAALYYRSATVTQGRFTFFVIGLLLLEIVSAPVIRFILVVIFPARRE